MVAPTSACPSDPITETRSESGRSSPPGPDCRMTMMMEMELAVIEVVESQHRIRRTAPTHERGTNWAALTAGSGGFSIDVLTCTPGEGPGYFFMTLIMALTPSCRPRLPLNEALGFLFAGEGMKSSLASRRRASRSRKR